ncbi:MAG: oxidoreductase, partial [Nocardioides sp.]
MTDDSLAGLMSFEGVPSAFAAVRDGIDAMLRDRGLRRTSPETTAESLLRGAHASAVLEGSESSLAEVREGSGDEVAQAALRVSTELLGQAQVLGRSPGQALARLHALAGAGSMAREDLGRPRDTLAAERLQGVTTLLTTPTSAPALVLAAVVHADLAVAAP